MTAALGISTARPGALGWSSLGSWEVCLPPREAQDLPLLSPPDLNLPFTGGGLGTCLSTPFSPPLTLELVEKCVLLMFGSPQSE